MNISINYFGMIAESTGKSSEKIETAEIRTVNDLRKELVNRYPNLSTYEFKIAIDANLVEDENEKIKPGALVALLPPFAGG